MDILDILEAAFYAMMAFLIAYSTYRSARWLYIKQVQRAWKDGYEWAMSQKAEFYIPYTNKQARMDDYGDE